MLYSTVMLKETLQQGQTLADAALERLLPPATQHPVSIHQAMRSQRFAGGKRLRPTFAWKLAAWPAMVPFPRGLKNGRSAGDVAHLLAHP